MTSFTALLLEISNEIETTELNKMKFRCTEHGIGAKRLEQITEAYELCKELIKRELLGPENKEILVGLLELAGRIDLKNKLLGIERSPMVQSRPTVPGAPVVNSVLQDTHLNDISEDLGREWKPLGRKLGISSNILGNIDEDYRRVKEKAFQTMLRWKKQNGNNATGQVLADALTAIGRKDIAETLARICRQDGLSIHQSEERPTNSPVVEDSRTDSAGGLNTMEADLAPKLPTQESVD